MPESCAKRRNGQAPSATCLQVAFSVRPLATLRVGLGPPSAAERVLEIQSLRPIPDILDQLLHFHKIPRWFFCTWKFGKQSYSLRLTRNRAFRKRESLGEFWRKRVLKATRFLKNALGCPKVPSCYLWIMFCAKLLFPFPIHWKYESSRGEEGWGEFKNNMEVWEYSLDHFLVWYSARLWPPIVP